MGSMMRIAGTVNDSIVDGPFIQEKRSLELDFCGSSNQRLIDVQQSLLQGDVRRK